MNHLYPTHMQFKKYMFRLSFNNLSSMCITYVFFFFFLCHVWDMPFSHRAIKTQPREKPRSRHGDVCFQISHLNTVTHWLISYWSLFSVRPSPSSEMTTLRRSLSTKAVQRACLLPAKTNTPWCDWVSRWKNKPVYKVQKMRRQLKKNQIVSWIFVEFREDKIIIK